MLICHVDYQSPCPHGVGKHLGSEPLRVPGRFCTHELWQACGPAVLSLCTTNLQQWVLFYVSESLALII